MAKTVKIPGVGSVPTKWAVVGGVAVVGIAGVAWWRYSNNKAAIAEETATTTDFTGATGDETVYPAYSTDYAPDESYDGGAYPYPTYTTPSYGLTSTVQTADPTTNSEWTQRSIEHLELLGIESQAGSLAVSRYLLKECVTATQGDIVRQAVAALGPPPQGTFSIIVCPTTPTQQQDDTPPAGSAQPTAKAKPGQVGPVVVKSSKTSASVNWPPVKGVRGYNIYLNGKYYAAPAWSYYRFNGLRAGTTYTVEIEAFNSAGYGPKRSVRVATKK